MIYKRGCNKKGPNGTCSKCGERGACGVYWYKFMWQGSLVRESTKQGNDKVARKMESAHRTTLALGEVGIRERKAAPTLKGISEAGLPALCRDKACGKTQHAAELHGRQRDADKIRAGCAAPGRFNRPACPTVR